MGRAIVVGDPHQAIYRFRGSDDKAFKRLGNMLGENGRTMQRLDLPVNYRCDAKIIEMAQNWVPGIQGCSNAPGHVGIINFHDALARVNNDGTDIEMADGIDGAVRSLPINDKPVSFAMLCRVNAPLVITAYKLIGLKKRVQIVGRKQIGQPLIDLIESLCNLERPNHPDYANRISSGPSSDGRFVEGLLVRLDGYLKVQRVKLCDEEDQNKLEQIEQNVECIKVIAEHVMDDKVTSIIAEIERLFVEEADPLAIQLSSCHRSKGLEWAVVFILRPDLMPHPMAKNDEDYAQELNCCYVAVTRAKHRLYFVGNWPFGNVGDISGKGLLEMSLPESVPMPRADVKTTLKLTEPSAPKPLPTRSRADRPDPTDDGQPF